MKSTRIVFLIMLLAVLFGTIAVSAILYNEEKGMMFDGLAEYNTASVDMPLPSTYEATVRFTSDYKGEGGVIFGSYSDDSTASFNFEVDGSGAPRVRVIVSKSETYDVVFNDVNLYNGEKTHVAIALDSSAGAWVCYINGIVAQTVSSAVPTQSSLTSVFALGGDISAGNYRYFRGEIFDLALYSDVRAASEIASDASAIQPDTDGLIVAYTSLKGEGADVTAIGDSKYNITYKCNWIKDANLDDYAYSFAVIGDIQSMTYYYPDRLIDQYEWIRDNAQAQKIAFSIGLGDITETNTAAEYLKVIEAYEKIDGVIPFSIIRGNHERTSSNDTTMYDTYITQERYGDEITGAFDDTMQSTYRIIQIGKVKYMFMNLDLTLSDGAIEWAGDVISAHPDCHVIVSTHAYKNMSGTYLQLASTGKFGVENDSQVLWDRLISQHENIVMLLYGHSPKDTIYKKQREGVNGNIVTEMLINPSETDKKLGGGGFVAMFYFSEDGTQLQVRNYSTAKGAYYMSASQFSLELGTPGTAEFTNLIMNVGADESERNLTWYSQYDTDGEVRYGRSTNGKLPETYSTAKATAVKASKAGYYSYKATMTGLEADATYVYQLVVGATASECYTFNTYGMGDDFSFAFITDPQVKQSSHSSLWDDTLDKIKRLFGGVSIVVSGGDQTSDPASEDNFDWFTSEHLSSIALATTVGPPHDNTQLYTDHYNLPNLSSIYGISTPSSDYFYTYNNVLFMHLNVENHDYDGHIRFMENAIADNPDCIWRVVVLHYSFFSGGNHSTDASVLNFRSAVAGKLSELDVDIVLSGHDHVYTRSNVMIDGSTVSSDIVTNGTVTDPVGTVYICGTSATGSGWYSVEHHDDDAYIAFSEDTNRKSVVIFTASEGSLTLKSYFIDGSTPEEFDSFTIQKTKRDVRLDKDSEMLEITDGSERISLVNAYAYTVATVKVVDGYWALSTNGGVSFVSLGIASSDTNSVLTINESTGIWELSTDGGASFESLGINARTYTVKYVALPGAAFGDDTDHSAFSDRRYTAATPDAPALYMPKGSMSVGNLYDWAWEYYLVEGDGTPVDSFEYGKSYVAYPVSSATPIASTIYVSSESNPTEYTYTWLEAWDIVSRCVGEKITLALKSDVTLTSADAISVVTPLDLTLDLGGYRLNTSAAAPAIKLAVGSNGSKLTVVTSVVGGSLIAGSSDFIEIGSNQSSTLTVQFGSTSTEALNVESAKYLVGANGNFKYTSTLNLSIYGGSYTVSRGIIYVSNVTTSAGSSSPNVYKLTLKDASFSFSAGDAAIVRAKSTAYYANAASFIVAEGCSFTDTYKSDHSSSRFLIREDIWYGTASFTDCDFIGMSIGADYTGAPLTLCSSITIGEGCTFTKSSKTFKSDIPLSFFSEKVSLAQGCVLARTDSLGSAEVLSPADAAEIVWENPVGYKEYWKLGTVPVYLGDSSFVVGEMSYSLVLAEQPVAANSDKTYTFVSEEGYLYRYDSVNSVWQISKDGGNTYTNIDGSEPAPEPEPTVGCTVTIDGVSTTFTPDTDFYNVISSFNTSSVKNKVVNITLGSDMSFSTPITFSKLATVEIDLAGHRLIYEADGRFQTGSGYTLRIYSSVAGGEFVFGGVGDGMQPGKGTVIFGSEEYKNTLTVSAKKEILNPGQTADGSTIRFVFLYCTVNVGSANLVRINAKGAGVVTFELEIVGCTVNGPSNLICYNYSSTLGATSNGGVCGVASYIRAEDTVFNCTAAAPTGLFGSGNFADRYFGAVSFDGCTFNNYTLNGDIIRSDESLGYNTYYDTIKDSGYDPDKVITVGSDCVFYSYGDTFTEDLTAFAASNVVLDTDCAISVGDGCVRIISNDFACQVVIDGIVTYYPKGTDFKDVLSAINTSANTGKEITVVLAEDMTIGGTVNVSSIKSYILNIDLAGNKLTADAGGRIRFGGIFTLNIYSSVVGGELIFKTGSDCVQLDTSGLLVLGSEIYKNALTVSAVSDLINVSQLSNRSVLEIKCLYSTVNAGSNGIVRLNAKGAGVVALRAEIVGCTVNGSSKVVCYNASSTLSATSNGGVYGVDSYINAVDSVFVCTADSPAGFFGNSNFTDRYFGTVSFSGCVFDNYVINGDLIRSDETISYNDYYNTIAGTGYDPDKAVTIGKDCVLRNYGATFAEGMIGFAASNVSTASGCFIAYTDESVTILSSAEHVLSGWIVVDGEHWVVCTSCGDGVILNRAPCNAGEATCTEPSACEVCGTVYGDALGHSYVDGICIRCGVGHPTISSASVTLGSSLAMNYAIYLPDGYSIDAFSMRFTMNGVVTTVTRAARYEGGYMFVLDRLAPQCMGDAIKAELCFNGEVVDTIDSYSIRAYAEKLLERYSNDEYVIALVTDMLNYGAAAQEYVEYKTDALVNLGLNGAASEYTPTESDNIKSVSESSDDRYSVYAVGVRFDYINRIFLKLDAPSLEGVTVTDSYGNELEITALAEGGYVVYSAAISATEFDRAFGFNVNVNGITVQAVTYSVNSYAYAKQDSGDTMGKLALALYRYGQSAVAYDRSEKESQRNDG